MDLPKKQGGAQQRGCFLTSWANGVPSVSLPFSDIPSHHWLLIDIIKHLKDIILLTSAIISRFSTRYHFTVRRKKYWYRVITLFVFIGIQLRSFSPWDNSWSKSNKLSQGNFVNYFFHKSRDFYFSNWRLCINWLHISNKLYLTLSTSIDSTLSAVKHWVAAHNLWPEPEGPVS